MRRILIPTPQTLPTPQALYGPGIGGDALANTRIGGPYLTKIFNRFRASQSSELVSFRFYYIGVATNYGAGTGGVWKAEVFADGGSHFPTGPALASQQVAPQVTHYAGKLVTFTTPATLVAGQLYHLVYENIDAAPTENYFSANNWFYYQLPTDAPNGQLNPKFPDTDWAHGISYDNGPWSVRPEYAPILELTYSNGASQGMSYGEASYDPGEVGRISGNAQVREVFTFNSSNQTVQSVGLRVLRETGSGTGNLTISLEDGSGAVLSTASIPASTVATGPAPNGTDSEDGLGVNAKWFTGTFSSPVSLVQGQNYRLRLSSTSTIYWAWVNRHLNHYDYTPSTYYSDGNAEKTLDGSTWSSLGRVSGENDLQFYLL